MSKRKIYAVCIVGVLCVLSGYFAGFNAGLKVEHEPSYMQKKFYAILFLANPTNREAAHITLCRGDKP